MAKSSNIWSQTMESFKMILGPAKSREANPSIDIFTNLEPDNAKAVHAESVIDLAAPGGENYGGAAKYESTSAYKELIYGRLSFDKPKRLKYYRNMAMFPEVADAIDEICDACIQYDENNNFIDLHFRDPGLNDEQKEVVKEEFKKFIALYDIENNGWEYFRSLIRDGEVAFENVINKNKASLGILKVKRIPSECFENLVNISYDIVGILLNAKILYNRMPVNNISKSELQSEHQGEVGEVEGVINQYGPRDPKVKMISLPINQITYINTGQFNHDKTIVFPVLETARRPYRQLSLIEDAIIIYRLIRAPERLVFNVDTGKLPSSKAEQMVLQLMKRYQSKKVYEPSSGSVHNDYDPHQMLESYWFARPEGSQGTQVTPLQGGQNLGQLEDLHYFLRKLYISLKVPYNRFSEQPVSYEKAESISYEEYRFSKFIMRIQQQFAKGIYDAFISQLKLIGIWKNFKMNKQMIIVKFTSPMEFELYEQQKLLQIKMTNFETATSSEIFSKDLAAMKYLGWTEEDIKKNSKSLEAELIRHAYINRKASNIEQFGNPHGQDITGSAEEEPGIGSGGDFGAPDMGDLGSESSPSEETPEPPSDELSDDMTPSDSPPSPPSPPVPKPPVGGPPSGSTPSSDAPKV